MTKIMLGSHSVIRRYTPPTCTLEIKAKSSPLSRWARHTIVKDLHFELRFDDPRISEEKQTTINGDRTQLELLSDVVNHYVQNFLLQSSVLPGMGKSTETHFADTIGQKSQDINIFLQPKGLVSHELFWQQLTIDSSRKISLTASQLFDLVNALDQYSLEMSVLPELNQSNNRQFTIFWGSAAAVAVLAISLIPLLTKLSNPTLQANESNTTLKQSESEAKKTSEIPLSPSMKPPRETVSIPSPQVPLELSSRGKLPEQNAPAKFRKTSDFLRDEPVSKKESVSTVEERQSVPTLPTLPSLTAKTSNQQEGVSELPSLSANTEKDSYVSAADDSISQDEMPQMAEVRKYFQNHWQPPQELNQALEYRLVINPNGSINEIIPLGQAAKTFINTTKMPKLGEQFISPLTPSKKAIIRLVLIPDGTVKTFLEN